MSASPHPAPSGWRERDLKGGHGEPPSSVRAVVERTRLGLVAARAAESFLLAVSAAATTMAVLVLEAPGPPSLASLDSWCLALVAGAFCGAGWHLEHRLDAFEVARALDRRLRHQGGLVTAFELENRGADAPMARLLVARVLFRLRAGEALRSMFPPLAVPVAAPILGIGLLAFALEEGRVRSDAGAALSEFTLGMAEALELVEAGVLVSDPDTDRPRREHADRVLAAARRARDLARRSASLAERPDEAWRELGALDDELADLTARLVDRPALREGLEQARAWAAAARMGLDPEAGASGVAAGNGAVASGGEEGTMSGSQPRGTEPDPGAAPPIEAVDPEHPDSSSGAGSDDPDPWSPQEVGTIGSYWPPEYDGVVSGWIELRRQRTTRR